MTLLKYSIHRLKYLLFVLWWSNTRFRRGQIWHCISIPDEPNPKLFIYSIEPDERDGAIFYCIPLTRWVPQITSNQREYALFPMTRNALCRSITTLTSESIDVPDMQRDLNAFREDYLGDKCDIYRNPLQVTLSAYRLLAAQSPSEST